MEELKQSLTINSRVVIEPRVCALRLGSGDGLSDAGSLGHSEITHPLHRNKNKYFADRLHLQFVFLYSEKGFALFKCINIYSSHQHFLFSPFQVFPQLDICSIILSIGLTHQFLLLQSLDYFPPFFFLVFFFFFAFQVLTCGIWKFPGQGSSQLQLPAYTTVMWDPRN